MDGKLYVSTHAGYYDWSDGMEIMVETPPEGYKLYPGGHILAYNLATGEWEDLAIAPDGEAFVTMTMDTRRGQIYGISWPKGYLLHYDVEKDELKNLGKFRATEKQEPREMTTGCCAAPCLWTRATGQYIFPPLRGTYSLTTQM